MVKFVGILPARLKSQRFPEKLLAKLQGKSVLQHAYESALKTGCLDQILILTDHEKIASVASSFQAPVIFTSAKPCCGTERIVEALLNNSLPDSATHFINLQADHPFTSKNTIQNLVKLFEQNKNLEIGTCVTPVTEAEALLPQIVKCVFTKNYNALYFSRSPIPSYTKNGSKRIYYQHVGIYGYSRSFLLNYSTIPKSSLEEAEDLEQLRFLEHGYVIKVALVNDLAQGVDVPEDLKKCEEILCQLSTSL